MKRLALLLLLAGCSSDSPPVIIPPQPPANLGWSFQYSPGMTFPQAYGAGGMAFSFPRADGVHYLTKTQGTPLAGGITIEYRIDATADAVFSYQTNPNNTCGPGYPGTLRLYFHKANDPALTDPFGRWFGPPQELKAGAVSLSVPFYTDPSIWVGQVGGTNGAVNLPQFQAALASVAEVGLVFGGGCFAGHGVMVPTGTAGMAASAFTAN